MKEELPCGLHFEARNVCETQSCLVMALAKGALDVSKDVEAC